MALSLRKTHDRGSVGLDIDGRYLAAAQVDGGRVVRCASHDLPEGVVGDGEVTDTDALTKALKSFAVTPDCRATCASGSPTSRSSFA